MNEMKKLTWSELEEIFGECNFDDEETQIIKRLSKGQTARQISIEMCLSEATVNRRKERIRSKMARTKIDKVPIWEKACMTFEETASYSNIGEKKLRELANDPYCKFTIRVGAKTLIKRKEFEKFLEIATEL